jgi:hypothetical protein
LERVCCEESEREGERDEEDVWDCGQERSNNRKRRDRDNRRDRDRRRERDRRRDRDRRRERDRDRREVEENVARIVFKEKMFGSLGKIFE